jgi:hypothetical protein
MHRVTWDLRYAEPTLVPEKSSEGDEDFPQGSRAPMVIPGEYTVSFAKQVNGVISPLGQPQKFVVKIIAGSPTNPEDRIALIKFQQQVADLYRVFNGTEETSARLKDRAADLKRALLQAPAAATALFERAEKIEAANRDITRALAGDEVLRRRNEPVPVSIEGRINTILGEQYLSSSRPTATHLEQYKIASDQLAQQLRKLRSLIEVDLAQLEKDAEAAGAPWTPGRIPIWPEQK